MCDKDESSHLNMHEYALLRAALTAFCPGRDGGDGPVALLRARILFAKYESSPNGLDLFARRRLVRELGHGKAHVDSILEKFDWMKDGSDVSFEKFLETELNKAHLKIDDAFCDCGRRTHCGPPPKVVLEKECVVAERGVAKRNVDADVTETSLNSEFKMSADLKAPYGSSWRGAFAAPRTSRERIIAEGVVDEAYALALEEMQSSEDIYDSEWLKDGKAMKRLLGGEAAPKAQADALVAVVKYATRIVAAEPTVVRVASAPVKIFGDIHGQLRDLLLLLAHHGFPTHKGGDVESVSYAFNGDWVDRGSHQIEVVLLLFSLKILYPARIFLVRGNHEFRGQSLAMGRFGFYHAVESHFVTMHEAIFEAVHMAFDQLPLGALVANAVFVVHGGIGDGTWGIEDLAAVSRPIVDERSAPKCVFQALWSDPADSDDDMMRGVHGNPRGENIPTFGPDVTLHFCERERIRIVVRSHQYVPDGCKFMHGGHCVTLFSARNYFNKSSNDSAILLIAHDEQGALRIRAKRLAHVLKATCDKQLHSHSS